MKTNSSYFKYFGIIILTLISILSAQERTISGSVKSQSDDSNLIGVNVVIPNTNIGTTTNTDGNFTLTMPPGSNTITFSYIGYEEKIVQLNGEGIINVVMAESPIEMIAVDVQGFANVSTQARRRVENIQNIPESVVALTSREIEGLGIENLPDFIEQVPNVSFNESQNLGTLAISVRGVTEVRNGEVPVAIVVDGVNQSIPNQVNQELFDIEHIEVVKGPQGALYGRNAVGGAINIITKKPTNNYQQYIKGGAGNGGLKKFIFSSSGPIVKDKALYRFAGSFKDREGLIKNSFTKKFVDPFKDVSSYGQLFLNLSNTMKLELTGHYSKTEGGATNYIIGDHPLLGAFGIPKEDGVDAMDANDFNGSPRGDEPGGTTRELNDYSLNFTWNMNFGTLTSTTGKSSVSSFYHGDLDFSPIRELLQQQKLETSTLNQNIMIRSFSDQKFRWIAGVFYQDVKRDLTTLGELSSAGIVAGLFGLPTTTLANEVLYPIVDAEESNNNNTVAAYGQVNMDIGTDMELSIGVRYDKDTKEQTNLKDNSVRKKTFSEIQPKVNISKSFSDDLFAYASYSKGYRSGGYNAPSIVNYPELYEAERTNNTEVGFKTSLMNDRFILNGSYYRIDFDQQQYYLVEIGGGGQIIINIGKTVHSGIDTDMKYRLSSNIDLFASFGMVNAEITEDGNSVPNAMKDSITHVGNVSPLHYDKSGLVAVQYNTDLGKTLNLSLRVEMEHRGKMYWHADNVDVQDPFNLMNLRLNLVNKGKMQYGVSAYIKNLQNTKYNTEYVAVEYSGALFGDLRYPNTPKTLGVDFFIRF